MSAGTMRSSNPVLGEDVFRNFNYADSTSMTATGMVVKTAIAILLALLTAGWTYIQFDGGQNVNFNPGPYMIGGVIVGLIASLVTMFKPQLAGITTPIYALAEGFFLGGISAIVQMQFPKVPIVFQAAFLTFAVLAVMLVCYRTGLIKVTQKLRMAVVACTGAICLLYVVSMLMRLFTGSGIGFIHSAGPLGIAFSVFVVGLAAFNLLLDFDLVDQLVAQRAPKYMEWYAAFALMVTLVWLYIEVLRLLSKLQSRD